MKALMLLSIPLLVCACSLPPKLTLSEVNPTRVYLTDKETLFQQVRAFSMREAYKIERFDLETGSIKGHKMVVLQTGAIPDPDATRHMIMVLRVKSLAEKSVELNATFSFGDYRGSFTAEDEGILVGEYNNLFSFLDDQQQK